MIGYRLSAQNFKHGDNWKNKKISKFLNTLYIYDYLAYLVTKSMHSFIATKGLKSKRVLVYTFRDAMHLF